MSHVAHQDSPPTVAIGIVNYNGAATLPATLQGVLAQDYPAITAMAVIDNASTDTSRQVVETFAGRIQFRARPDNRGPNPARNEALRMANTDLTLIMDNDIVLAPDYVRQLVALFVRQPDTGAATGQIQYAGHNAVQYNGAWIHYAGEIVLNREIFAEPRRMGAISAGAVLLNRTQALKLGGFDEDFIFGWEDGDLTFRLASAGAPCYAVSQAVCQHLKSGRSLKWARYQVRNRWWFILKHYNMRTFWLALPGILLFQMAGGFFLFTKGHTEDFIKGSWDAVRTIPTILRKRRVIMAHKTMPDSELLVGGRPALPENLMRNPLAILVQCALSGWWKIIRPFIR